MRLLTSRRWLETSLTLFEYMESPEMEDQGLHILEEKNLYLKVVLTEEMEAEEVI